MAKTMYLSINTLKVNGLNSPIKRYRVAEWIRKYNMPICCLQEIHLKNKQANIHTQTESEGIEKNIPSK